MADPTMADPTPAGPLSVVPALRPDPDADGQWLCDFPAGLRSIGGVMHGGAVVAAITQAAIEATGRRPSTITTHLHLGVEPGPAQIAVDVLTSGRTSTTARATLTQGRLRTSATILLTADEPSADLPVTVAAEPLEELPPAPARTFSPPARTGGSGGASFGSSVDVVYVGDARPMAGGDEALIQGWLRPRVPSEHSAATAAMLLDALPPTLLVLRTEPALIFTIEYTLHLTPVAHLPIEPGQWFFMRQHTVWAVGDLSVDDAQLWTDDGRLVGSARQLRRHVPAR